MLLIKVRRASTKMNISLERIASLSKTLTAIASVTGQEARLADLIQSHLGDLKVAYRLFEENPGQPNIVVELPGKMNGLICFNGHMDVIPAQDVEAWASPPFEPTLTGNRLYGRGAVDMKSVLALYLHLIEELASSSSKEHHRVQFQFVSDEERGGEMGTGVLTRQIEAGALSRPDLVIIGERSDLKLRVADRGCVQVQVKLKGKSAHTAWARAAGINPLYYAAKAILSLERPLPGFDPLVGHPVVSINTISAGTALNQVPAECSFSIDWRTTPEESAEAVLRQIEEKLQEICSEKKGLRYELTLLAASEGSITKWDCPEVEAVGRCVAEVMGRTAEIYVGWAGSTDARFFRELGIPAVVLGPCGGNYHGANEYVELDSVGALARIFARLLSYPFSSGVTSPESRRC